MGIVEYFRGLMSGGTKLEDLVFTQKVFHTDFPRTEFAVIRVMSNLDEEITTYPGVVCVLWFRDGVVSATRIVQGPGVGGFSLSEFHFCGWKAEDFVRHSVKQQKELDNVGYIILTLVPVEVDREANQG